jgi:hypothetical protein
MGRPTLPDKVVSRIVAERNADGVPTAHGGAQWWRSTVRSVLQRVEAK